MATIRQIEESDIPAVSELFLEVSPEARWPSAAACGEYMRELLFRNPWCDLDVPSWLAEEHGEMTGFYLLLPRSMDFCGERIRVAVGCQMSVHPAHRRSLIALQLAKVALNGSQDLTIADGAHEKSRDMWLALGGTAPLSYNLHWIRPLRPARQLLSTMRRRGLLPAPFYHAFRPLTALVDLAAARLRWNRFLSAAQGRADEVLDASSLLTGMENVTGADTLKPSYDQASISWLLEQASAKVGRDALRGRVVRTADGQIAGWYLYSLQRGGISDVIQLAAPPRYFDTVLCRLLCDAHQQGAAAVRGRGEPGHIEELSARHCWFRREGACTLVHTHRREIGEAIAGGRAFLSKLEGEWWLRLVSG